MDGSENLEDVEDEAYCLYEKEISIDRNSIIFLKYKNEDVYSSKPYKVEIKNIIISNEDEKMSEEDLKKAQVNKEEQKNNQLPYYINRK